jgi:MoxR-like ATPase
MADPRPHPLWFAELRREGGLSLVLPLTMPAPFGVERSVVALAQQLGQAVEDAWMEEGRYLQLPSALPALAPEVVGLEIEVPEVDRLRPALRMRLPAVLARLPSGHGVFVPELELHGWGESAAAALESARQAVLTYLTRGNRRENPRALVQMTWWSELVLHEEPLLLHRYSFHERKQRAAARERREQRQLEDCAARIPAQRAYEMEEYRQELRRALHARVGAGVLVVGPTGCGKTALVADEASAPGSAFAARGPVWTTTAARLEHALTRSGPWQEPLARLCQELHQEKVWLHVANLADLFEVGRYEGNDTSLAEYLRPWLGRGEIALVTECTPEQLANIEVRYPSWLEYLVQVQIPAPDDARLSRVVGCFLRELADSESHSRVEPEAGDEAMRLQRRFVPYSGFPGRTLRFLGALAHSVPSPVLRTHVVARFCEESGIPRAFVDPQVRLPHAELHARFASALYGQPAATSALLDVATAIKADVAPRGRPVASLLFVGPTGVGKTEAARALASVLFGSPDRMVRFDMSEFATPHAVLALTTSPEPHGEGRLTGAVRRQPFCVLLLDEVEKAHPDFFDLLLQVLGEGRLTDHRGRVADFCSTIVVMTSNLGAELAQRARVGLGRQPELEGELKDAVFRWLRPELVNRIDRIVPFTPLSPEAVLAVLDRELHALSTHRVLLERKATLSVSPEARAWLARRGYDPARGARPLQRVLRDELVSGMAAQLDADPSVPSPRIEVGLSGETLQIRFRAGPELSLPSWLLGRVSQLRRQLQAVCAGETWSVHQGACHLALRAARTEAVAGRFRERDVGDLYEMPAPLEALQSCLARLVELEAREMGVMLGGQPRDPQTETLLHELELQMQSAWQELTHRVHPWWNTAYLALWSPADEPAIAFDPWVGELMRVAEAFGIQLLRRDLWACPDEQWIDTALDEPRPRQATKWAATELWATGPAAALLLPAREGLYSLKGPPELRCRLIIARPKPPQLPSCCSQSPPELALLLPGEAQGPIHRRWKPPRSASWLRKQSVEGQAKPWPPSQPSREAYVSILEDHLRRKGDA